LPTIIATVHQALRYLFVGAIAAVFVVVPPGEAWSRRVRPFLAYLADVENAGAVLAVLAVAILIGGSLIYGAHRVVVYPVIFRIILWTVMEKGSASIGRFLWPYGKAVSSELGLRSLEFALRAVITSVSSDGLRRSISTISRRRSPSSRSAYGQDGRG
jgi:hypothetical protein